MLSSRRPCGFVATAPCPIDALHLGTGQVVLRRPRLLRLVASIALLLLHCCLRRASALAHVALALSVSRVVLVGRAWGADVPLAARPATIAPPHQCCIVAAADMLPSRCCHTVTVAPLLRCTALPLHCSLAAIRHCSDHHCRRGRVAVVVISPLRSHCRCFTLSVAVAPSWSWCGGPDAWGGLEPWPQFTGSSTRTLSRRRWCVVPLDPCHRRGHHSVTSPSRQCGHVVIVRLGDNRCPYALRGILRCLWGMSVAPGFSAVLATLSA